MIGERMSAARRASLDHALAGYYAEQRERTGFRDFHEYLKRQDEREIAGLLRPFSTGSLRHLLSDEGDDLLSDEACVTVFDLRLLEPELRPAAAMVCTETVWAAAARDPRPRLLVVDEVWTIMQHPEGAAFMVSVAKRARKHRLGLRFITQDVQDLLAEDPSNPITGHSGRAMLQNAAFKLLLQQDAAAIGAVGEAFDLTPELKRWLVSCPRGDGLLIAREGKFPIRIEATPEETRIVEWNPRRPCDAFRRGIGEELGGPPKAREDSMHEGDDRVNPHRDDFRCDAHADEPRSDGSLKDRIIRKILGRGEDPPQRLWSVIPPRTGERTMLGVENLLASIAAPEPFSLEMAGDADGVTLMARCLDGSVVEQQMSAHYPQAVILEVDPENDPLRLVEGERAWSTTLRAWTARSSCRCEPSATTTCSTKGPTPSSR